MSREMESFRLHEEENEQIEERYTLSMERIARIPQEKTVPEPYREYFTAMAEWLLLIHRTQEEVLDGSFEKRSLAGKEELNQLLYEDILPEHYGRSFANPEFSAERLGTEQGRMFAALAAELRGLIPAAFEGRRYPIALAAELFIEIYNYYEDLGPYTQKDAKRAIYSYVFDYAQEAIPYKTRQLLDPTLTFARELIMEADLSSLDYLYRYGDYISDNERRLSAYFAAMTEEEVQAVADTYTDGYIRGFAVTGADFSAKSIISIQYCLGFERMIRAAIRTFEGLGKKVSCYRTSCSLITGNSGGKNGSHGVSPNPQYEYDHRADDALILDGALVDRRLTALRGAYEQYRIEAGQYAGPAVQMTFGEKKSTPILKEAALRYDERQRRLAREYRAEAAQIQNVYMPSEGRSFTIIAYPLPSVGERFEEIFERTRMVNNLDNEEYKRIQQAMIDVLDKGDYCTIEGMNGNETDLKVMLHELNDPDRETIFENCTADVNIPAGEVFTSPVLAGTGGLLHVSRVMLGGLPYEDLRIRFEDGMTKEYSCGNFDSKKEGSEYIRENLLSGHESLPLGEFAIGTNTTAYQMGREFGITDLLPILIAEKTGPHFAVGDTCYCRSEERKVYNPDGKEIIARENEVSALRHTDPEKAYYNCHTDITIPYHEIGEIAVHFKEGGRAVLIKNGRFVLPGTEELNRAFGGEA